jgi:hypothetical protein
VRAGQLPWPRVPSAAKLILVVGCECAQGELMDIREPCIISVHVCVYVCVCVQSFGHAGTHRLRMQITSGDAHAVMQSVVRGWRVSRPQMDVENKFTYAVEVQQV